MKKYKELLKEIICNNYCSKNYFIKIDSIIYKIEGIEVWFDYYKYNEITTKTITIYNSELNAYMYENIN